MKAKEGGLISRESEKREITENAITEIMVPSPPLRLPQVPNSPQHLPEVPIPPQHLPEVHIPPQSSWPFLLLFLPICAVLSCRCYSCECWVRAAERGVSRHEEQYCTLRLRGAASRSSAATVLHRGPRGGCCCVMLMVYAAAAELTQPCRGAWRRQALVHLAFP